VGSAWSQPNRRHHRLSDARFNIYWQTLHRDLQFQLESVDMLDNLTDSPGMKHVELSLYAVDVGRSLAEKDVYVPIYNRHLRQWRDQHQRGGDILIMTEPKLIKLQQPILIDMPEVCK
jgi:hypothetical protein